MNRGRQLCLKAWEQRLNAVHHLHGVCSRLTVDGELNGTIVVVPARGLVVFYAVDDAAELRKPYGGAMAVGDDQRGITGRIVKLTGGLDVDRLLTPPKGAGRQVYIFVI